MKKFVKCIWKIPEKIRPVPVNRTTQQVILLH